MKIVIKIISFIAAVILLVVGIVVALFGEGSIAIPIVLIIASAALMIVAGFLGKKRIVLRVLSVVGAIVFALTGGLLTNFAFNYKGAPVADYDNRVEIWGDNIPGNSTKSKLDEMNYNKNARLLGATLKFIGSIAGDEYKDAEKEIDTFTYVHGIKGGYEKETFEDVPYLIPYTVENSDEAVIVICGGGYGYKSIDGGTDEGKDVAVELNKQGVNAFVLWYRSNPYERPIPQLDLQRAVRYLKYHANDFGINTNKISLLGFSAGGYQVSSFINQFMGKENQFPQGYTPDEIDSVDDNVKVAAMIYPALTYRHNVPMLFSSFNDEDVRNETKREELLKLTDLTAVENFDSKNTKQLVAYGTKDSLVGMDGAKAYIATAKAAGTNITEVMAKDQDHGFGTKYYLDEFLKLVN